MHILKVFDWQPAVLPRLQFPPPPPHPNPSPGETLSGATTVGQLGVSPGQLVELQVQQAMPIVQEGEPLANYPLNTSTTHSTHRMPDVFTVQV